MNFQLIYFNLLSNNNNNNNNKESVDFLLLQIKKDFLQYVKWAYMGLFVGSKIL